MEENKAMLRFIEEYSMIDVWEKAGILLWLDMSFVGDKLTLMVDIKSTPSLAEFIRFTADLMPIVKKEGCQALRLAIVDEDMIEKNLRMEAFLPYTSEKGKEELESFVQSSIKMIEG